MTATSDSPDQVQAAVEQVGATVTNVTDEGEVDFHLDDIGAFARERRGMFRASFFIAHDPDPAEAEQFVAWALSVVGAVTTREQDRAGLLRFRMIGAQRPHRVHQHQDSPCNVWPSTSPTPTPSSPWSCSPSAATDPPCPAEPTTAAADRVQRRAQPGTISPRPAAVGVRAPEVARAAGPRWAGGSRPRRRRTHHWWLGDALGQDLGQGGAYLVEDLGATAAS